MAIGLVGFVVLAGGALVLMRHVRSDDRFHVCGRDYTASRVRDVTLAELRAREAPAVVHALPAGQNESGRRVLTSGTTDLCPTGVFVQHGDTWRTYSLLGGP